MQIIQFDAGPFFEETINTNEHYSVKTLFLQSDTHGPNEGINYADGDCRFKDFEVSNESYS